MRLASQSINPRPLEGREMALTELNDGFAALAADSINGKILVTPSQAE